jgi:hypothetical protein
MPIDMDEYSIFYGDTITNEINWKLDTNTYSHIFPSGVTDQEIDDYWDEFFNTISFKIEGILFSFQFSTGENIESILHF